MKTNNIIKVELTADQVIDLTQFLSEVCKEPVENWSEWGEDWCHLYLLQINLSYHLKGNILECDEDTFWGLFNFLNAYADEAICDKKGKETFLKYRNLSAVIYKPLQILYPDSFPHEIFVSSSYNPEVEKEKIYVDPRSNPEDIIKQLMNDHDEKRN